MGAGASKNKKRPDEASPEAQQQQAAQATAGLGPPEAQRPSAEAGNEPAQAEGGGDGGSGGAEQPGQPERGRTPEKQAPAERDSSPFARKQFFFNKGRERLGPVKWDDLQDKFRTGEFHEKSLVWYKALGGQFVFLKDHPELHQALRDAVGEDEKKGESPAEKGEGKSKDEGRRAREEMLEDEEEEEEEEEKEAEDAAQKKKQEQEQEQEQEQDGEKKEEEHAEKEKKEGGAQDEEGEELFASKDPLAVAAELRAWEPKPEPKPEPEPEPPTLGAELRRRSRSASQTGPPQSGLPQSGSPVPASPAASPVPGSPTRSPRVAAANRRKSSTHSDGDGGELWQRVRAWHRRTSGDLARSKSEAPAGGGQGAISRWLEALDQIQRYTPEEQAARDKAQRESMQEREQQQQHLQELQHTIDQQQNALERAQQAIEEATLQAQRLQLDVVRLEAKLAEQAKLLEKPRTREKATQMPPTKEERQAEGGEEEEEGEREEEEGEAVAKRKLLPREVVEIAHRVEWVLSHTQMELLEVMEHYDQDGSGMITELGFEKALSNKPLALNLPQWQLRQLWLMIGTGLQSRLKKKTVDPPPNSDAPPPELPSDSTEAEKQEGEEEAKESLPHAFDVTRVARSLLPEESEDVSEAIRVLRHRLLELDLRVLPVLNKVDPDGSGAVSFFAFKRALGAGGISGVNLSEGRLIKIWRYLNSEGVGWVDAREAAFVLEPPGSSYGTVEALVLSPLEEVMKERDLLLEMQRADRHRLFQYEECLAIAVRRLKIMDREWGTKFGQGLLGPISEAGRLGTPTKGRGALTYFAGGDELHKDTLAISVAPLVLEEAIFQLDAYNLRIKQAKAPKKKEKKDGKELLDRSRREALRAASFIVDGLFLRALPKPTKAMTQVKIYLSAHADDFSRERSGLNSMNAFQELKRFLQQRGLHPVLVDLRPGRKETSPSHTAMDLQVLFQEIRSSWAFIGLLGPNYGAQVSAQAAAKLSEKKGLEWTESLGGRSLTEVEITTAFRHIYSDDEAFLRHALIYIRSDATEDGSSENELRWVRQRQLLEDVQLHREFHCRPYHGPALLVRSASIELAKCAVDDWGDAAEDGANQLLPPPFWRGESQAAVCASLLRAYSTRDKEEETLDRYLALDPELPPLVVVGGSGSGKSALLRGWSAKVQTRGSKEVASVLSYFATDSYEPQPTTALLQIMAEMKHQRCLAPSDHVRAMASQSIRHNRLRDMAHLHRTSAAGVAHVDSHGGESVLYGRALPLEAQEVLEQFPQWCEIAGTRRQLLLVLDCMDQLSAPAVQAPWKTPKELSWVPQKRVHTRVVLGLRVEAGGMVSPEAPGGDEALRALQCFRRWNWPILEVPALTMAERETLARTILAGSRDPSTLRLSLDTHLQGSAAALSLFYSLSLWANDVTLDITSASQTVHQLCDWVLLAWEGACADEADTLVAIACRMLYVARHGLSYNELTSLVREGQGAVSAAGIARFFYVTSIAVAPMAERCHFVLRPMREAVQRAYIPTRQQEASARLTLAAFFAKAEGGHSLERVAGEYPWQLEKVGSWEMLRDAVSALPLFMCLWGKPEGVADLTHYWSQNALKARYNVVEDMTRSLDTFLGHGDGRELRKGEQLEYIAAVARFLHLLRVLEAAEVQYVRAVTIATDIYGTGHSRTITAVREYASVLHDQQRWEEGFTQVECALEMCEEQPLLYIRVHNGGLRGQGPDAPTGNLNEPATGSASGATNALPVVRPGLQLEMPAGPGPGASAIGRREGEAVANPLSAGGSALGPLIIALKGSESEEASACWELRGRLTRGLGRYDEAVGCFQKAVVLNELYYYLEMWNNTLREKGSLTPSLAIQLISFARALHHHGREERESESEAMLLHAQHVLEDTLGPKHADVATHALQALAELYGQGMGRWVDAYDVLKKAARIFEAALGKEHEKTKRARADAEEARVNMLQSRASRHQPAPVSSIGLL